MKLNILTIRQSKGISQKDLAEMIKVSIPTISRYENGARTPSIGNAHKIAQALGCTVDDLFREAASDAAAGDDEAGKGSDEKRTHDRDDGAGTFRDA